MLFQATVIIWIKPGIQDAKTEEAWLEFENQTIPPPLGLRAGILIDIKLEDENQEKAQEEITKMCDTLLANPVHQEYEIRSLEPFESE